MKLQDMLNRGFVKIEGQPRIYKQVTETMVLVYDDRGNGDYEIGDFIVLNGKMSIEEQINAEAKEIMKLNESWVRG